MVYRGAPRPLCDFRVNGRGLYVYTRRGREPGQFTEALPVHILILGPMDGVFMYTRAVDENRSKKIPLRIT